MSKNITSKNAGVNWRFDCKNSQAKKKTLSTVLRDGGSRPANLINNFPPD